MINCLSKRQIAKILIILILIGGFCSLIDSNKAQAAVGNVTISPPKFEETVNTGDKIDKLVKITNNSAQAVTLTPIVQDFAAAKDEGGNPTFVDPSEVNGSFSLATWINMDRTPITIKPQETAKIPFSILVPREAEPGGHYGTLFFVPPMAAGQIRIEQRIGSLILVRVNGEIKEEGTLKTFDIFTNPDTVIAENIKKADRRRLFSSLPVTFTTRLEDTGNVHLKPQGKIEIRNIWGKKMKSIGTEIMLNSTGAITGEKEVDYLPVNNEGGNVLPGSTRKFNTIWGKGSAFGLYSATLNITYGSSGKASAKLWFWVVNWIYIVVFLIIVLLIVAIYFLSKKLKAGSQQKMKAKIKEELEQELRAQFKKEKTKQE